MQAISTKQLRENLPQIRRELARGVSYTLIYRSRPIARLEPLEPQGNSSVRLKGGGFRFQANLSHELTPEYLNHLAENKYD